MHCQHQAAQSLLGLLRSGGTFNIKLATTCLASIFFSSALSSDADGAAEDVMWPCKARPCLSCVASSTDSCVANRVSSMSKSLVKCTTAWLNSCSTVFLLGS